MPVLQFKGKSAIETYHHTVPHHALEYDEKLSVLKSGTKPSLKGNLVIEGDNLVALKALIPTHAGKIKCIYLDPPYNTGNEGWIYNDNLTQPQFKEWIGQIVGKEEEDACRHDKWCCMMYPRLQIHKELMREDGVIFVSIDDHEIHNLRCLMDEVFGVENFVAQLVWEKGRKNDAKLFSVGHEYMVCYARSMESLRKQKTVWREPKPGAQDIWDEYCKLRKKHKKDDNAIEKALHQWFQQLPDTHPSKKLSRYKHVDSNGPWRDRDISWPGGGGPRYNVMHPKTKKPCKVPERGWGFASSEKMQEQIALGLVVFREDETEPPFRKAHLRPIADELSEADENVSDESDDDDTATVGMQVMPSCIYTQSQSAVKHLRNIFNGEKIFNNPKDHEVLARILRYCTRENDIILDSFAGSGTTGEAVLLLNKEENSNRSFILVQQPYETKQHQEEQFNICRKVTQLRIQRVINGYVYKSKNGQKQNVPGYGGTFAYARLSETPIFGQYRDITKRPPSYAEIAKYIFYTETSSIFDSSDVDKNTGKIGEHGSSSFYLLYTPSHNEDKALDLSFLKTTAIKDKNPNLVIYCEKIWIHRNELLEWQQKHNKIIRTMIVPFNLK